MENAQTPLEDLRKDALSHYDEASMSIMSHDSVVPKAINFYFDHLIQKRSGKITKSENCKIYKFLFYILLTVHFILIGISILKYW